MKRCMLFVVFLAFAVSAQGQYVVQGVRPNWGLMMPPLTGPQLPKNFPVPDVVSVYPITRISDARDMAAFHASDPTPAPVEGAQRPITWVYGDPEHGLTNEYSKIMPTNVTGEYMFASMPNGMAGLYRLSDCHYMGEIARSADRAVYFSDEPRWDRSRIPGTEYTVYYHVGTKLYKQDIRFGWGSQVEVSTLSLNGRPVIYSGGEGDWDYHGRYFAFMFGVYNQAAGRYQNVLVGVYDNQTQQVLPGAIEQHPNAVDISPSGKWLAVLPHTSDGGLQYGNRFYRISDLEQGITTNPVYVDSAIVNNFRSIGHNGWGFDKDGNEVLVYQDNRDDWMKAFDPEKGTSFRIYYMGWWGFKSGGFHIAGQKNPNVKGWFLYSSYQWSNDFVSPDRWDTNQLMMIEIQPINENPRVWRLGSTQNLHRSYTSEAFASIDNDGKHVYWGANWGATTNLEIFRMELPQDWQETLATSFKIKASTGDWVLALD